jgi:hypothetical protein
MGLGPAVTIAADALPEIPIVEAPEGPLQLARMLDGRLPRIVDRACEIILRPLLRWGDRYALQCLRRAGNPYRSELDAIAGLLGVPGAYALNFSFELGCTTACRSSDGVAVMQLYRTLDWAFRLGQDVVVARHTTPVGPYDNITWPGYAGVLTDLAPARFVAAINQPPMTHSFGRVSLGLPVDWMVERWRVRNAIALPPTHLLRLVFEQCTSFAEAKAMLATTPVRIPVTYTLTGIAPDEGCVIERREHDCVVHAGPICVANHWLNASFRGRPRCRNSRPRLAALPSLGDGERFDWVRPPVQNMLTRMAAELDAGSGGMAGWHGATPQTQVLEQRGRTSAPCLTVSAEGAATQG